jgi:hypothetical protein
MPTHEFSAGLETLCASLLTLESALITAAGSRSGHCRQDLDLPVPENRHR